MKASVVTTLEKRLAPLLLGGIRYRLFLLVTLMILPFASLLGITYYRDYETRREHALEAELEVARGLAVTFNAYLNGIRKQTLSLGHAITALPASEVSIKELLGLAVASSPSVRNMSWVRADGVVLQATDPKLIGVNLSRRPYFEKILAGRDFAVGNLSESGAVTRRPTVATATAIRHGGLRGVVVTAIEPTRLHEVVLSEKRPEEGALAIFDAHGALVYHSDFKDPTWQQRLSWRLGDHILVRVQQTQREQAGIQTLTQQRSGKWVSARVPLPELGWVAGAGRPERVAFQELRQGLVEDAFLGCAVSALAFALAYLLGRSISGPLLRLEEDAQVMGEAKMVLRDDPLAPDEVRSLRDALVTMTGALFQRSVDLRESEVSLRTILDNVYDGIIIHDLQGRIVQVNRRWLEMVRLAPHQVEGLTIPDASAGDPSPEVLGALWRQVLAGESRLFEWRARRPGDGSEFDSEVFLCAIRLKGQDLLMGNVRDVTERKRVAAELQRARDELEIRVQERTAELASAFEELKNETEQRIAAVEELRRKEQLLIQQSRLAAMGEIMVHIAHQWRQPLNTIGLLVQDLALSYQMETLSAEEVETQTKKVMAVLDHLSRTIDDFRNLFSPDKTKAPFSTRDVVERALSLLSPEFKETQVEMELLCDERDCEVEGFRNEYLQVILNVLSNARDVLRANQVAHPRITIRLFRESGRSVVTVADNGGGINPAIIGRIFDPYFTTKGQDKGTGIGLFMSKTIIEKNMGGSLSARNTEDGAEFRIEL